MWPAPREMKVLVELVHLMNHQYLQAIFRRIAADVSHAGCLNKNKFLVALYQNNDHNKRKFNKLWLFESTVDNWFNII